MLAFSMGAMMGLKNIKQLSFINSTYEDSSVTYIHACNEEKRQLNVLCIKIHLNNLKETVLTSKIILFQILPSFLLNPYNCVNFKKWFYKIVSITGTYCLASISCVSVFLFSRTTSASSI